MMKYKFENCFFFTFPLKSSPAVSKLFNLFACNGMLRHSFGPGGGESKKLLKFIASSSPFLLSFIVLHACKHEAKLRDCNKGKATGACYYKRAAQKGECGILQLPQTKLVLNIRGLCEENPTNETLCDHLGKREKFDLRSTNTISAKV